MPYKDRGPLLWLSIGVVVALVGGAILFAYTVRVAHTNTAFICSFGKALNASPLQQRAEESPNEFRKRVATTRQFVNELNRLQDCDPPALLRIKKESRPILRPRKGGGGNPPPTPSDGGRTPQGGSEGVVNQSQAPPGQQPSPPGNPGGGNNGGNGNNPPPSGGVLDEVTDTVCGLTPNGLPILC